ncbi:hypothetical protein FA13DRAFT_1775758, partial [Coprinellus micaceus]
MSISQDEAQALADAVAAWRTQEYIYIPFCTLYVYYMVTTIAEEVSIIVPQKWTRAKSLYMVIRYSVLAHIALQLCKDYRTYLSITPPNCKAIWVISEAARWIAALVCDVTLGLCLGALLQAKIPHLIVITALSSALPFIAAVLEVGGSIQFPAEPTSDLDNELGYPCYWVSSQQLSEETMTYAGRTIRSYLNLATTTPILGIATLIVRYKGTGSRLLQVIRRDGGVHY